MRGNKPNQAKLVINDILKVEIVVPFAKGIYSLLVRRD